jgi:hypothetical protein
MPTEFIGVTFPATSQWNADEVTLIATVRKQIEQAFPIGNNLLINLTWFGPQFDTGEYEKVLKLKVDRIFFMSSVDAPMMNAEQLEQISKQVNAQEIYYLGNFETKHQFTFIATLLPKYFKHYNDSELVLSEVNHRYVNYNRKPRIHRVDLVNQLIANGLDGLGVITLGEDVAYSNGPAPSITLCEQPEDYAQEGNWGHGLAFGIPHDIHSLGNMSIWRHHFLNIVSETEFNPWDPMFITEKTWKPILGLRPFLINGQTQIYQYLKDNGFCTFEKYFPVDNQEVHAGIISTVKYLKQLPENNIVNLYRAMLPDLLHNRNRFTEFVQEQQHKINNLFQ